MAEIVRIPKIVKPFEEDPEPSAAGHYLMIMLEDGTRTYFPLAAVDEEPRQALARWIETQVSGRKRNVDRAREQVRATVAYTRVVHPSSWWATQPPTQSRRRR